jgi:hypothetical protein
MGDHEDTDGATMARKKYELHNLSGMDFIRMIENIEQDLSNFIISKVDPYLASTGPDDMASRASFEFFDVLGTFFHLICEIAKSFKRKTTSSENLIMRLRTGAASDWFNVFQRVMDFTLTNVSGISTSLGSKYGIHEESMIRQWSVRQLRLTLFRGSIIFKKEKDWKMKQYVNGCLNRFKTSAEKSLPTIMNDVVLMSSALDACDANLRANPTSIDLLQPFIGSLDVFSFYAYLLGLSTDATRVAETAIHHRKNYDIKIATTNMDICSKLTREIWAKFVDLMDFITSRNLAFFVALPDDETRRKVKMTLSNAFYAIRGNTDMKRYNHNSVGDMIGFSGLIGKEVEAKLINYEDKLRMSGVEIDQLLLDLQNERNNSIAETGEFVRTSVNGVGGLPLLTAMQVVEFLYNFVEIFEYIAYSTRDMKGHHNGRVLEVQFPWERARIQELFMYRGNVCRNLKSSLQHVLDVYIPAMQGTPDFDDFRVFLKELIIDRICENDKLAIIEYILGDIRDLGSMEELMADFRDAFSLP